MTIPEELLEQFERGNVLLFVGERILRDGAGQVVIDQLTGHLAARSGAKEPEQYTFAEAAQAFADQAGRQALLQFVLDQLAALDPSPQPIHHLLARLTHCRVLVTTSLESRLEQALAATGRPLDVIIGNVDVAFVDEANVQLYKLRGSVERVDSLILTESDYETFFEDQASLSLMLQAELARKTVLFIGYDLADPYFKQLYRKVTAPLDDYARRAYAFGALPNSRAARWCERQNIKVIEVNPITFVEALTEQLAGRVSTRPPVGPAVTVETKALPESPYKFLDYYESKDTAIFFGRAAESHRLTALIHAHRLVLLYGTSGTGKTSLLLAGAVPRLAQSEPPYEVLFLRALAEPRQALQQALARRYPQLDLPPDGPLLESVARVTTNLARPLIIILDQFEEFFIRHSSQTRQVFITELAALYEGRDLPVKLVLSLREDWLAGLSELESQLPEVYRIKMRLLPFSAEQARQAITAPLAPFGIQYEAALLERLLADLSAETQDNLGGAEPATVLPPQLQLVCNALYERVHKNQAQTITLADYEAIGQAQGILQRYLEGALLEYASQERTVAKTILMALVTSQGPKQWVETEQLARQVGSNLTVLESVLGRLLGQRLIRRLAFGQAYELAHDVLAPSIATWFDETGRRLQQARELLRRELTDWQESAVLLSESKFQRIGAVREELNLDQAELNFLLRAAILYDQDVPYWLSRHPDLAGQIRILLEMLHHHSALARLTAARYLASPPQPEVASTQPEVASALTGVALDDTAPEVRDTAALSLAQTADPESLTGLIEAATRPDGPQPARAIRALALIEEAAPGKLKALPRPTRQRILRELAKIRFWRHWPRIRLVTAAGAIGGAAAFGLGLTPPVAVQLARLSQPLTDLIIYAPLLTVLGLVAGAFLAFGLSSGAALFGRRPKWGRVVGGTLLGGLGFALVLSPLAIVDAPDLVAGLTVGLGGVIFGALTGFGLTVTAVLSRQRVLALAGGGLGAIAGLFSFGALGFDPFQVVAGQPLVWLSILFSGGVVGAILAFTIGWAEVRFKDQITPQAGGR
jgi:hypothetical protein